tara:strand:- start:226 stop:1923 length:1698 start_codon:yes stop_codon:yes gene_type:complete
MNLKRIKELKKTFKDLKIDGYVIPKNDEFFSEYSREDRLKLVSNFTGSAGCAILLKKKNYLFVDGRYSIQALKESGKNFKIVKYEKILDCNLFKNKTLGIDPNLFTSDQIKRFFTKKNKIKEINSKRIEKIFRCPSSNQKPFFSLNDKVTGENYKKKINKVAKWLKKNGLNYLFISSPENVAWLLNVRGFDNPYSPIPNSRLLLSEKGKTFFFAEQKVCKKLILEKKLSPKEIVNHKNFREFLGNLQSGKIVIDRKSCSLFFENILKKKFKIVKKVDPIYHLKSIKNPIEIKGMINSHILDGVALTKFLYWIKNVNKKKITEFQAQKKLESFRKLNKNYLHPSFNTIAGAGGNGAIVHYRADKKKSKKIEKKDIFLCDSGGQYKYGTTDVTRTICFMKPDYKTKNIFTKVLKGHIAVATSNLQTNYNGKLIDIRARKYLKRSNLDYEHGTGHGVGFYLNVHEGPQAISKFNSIKISKGMILSNEPGFYQKGKFGIRIENLLFVSNLNKKLFFENLTLAPIEKDLINFDLLNKDEKNYLFRYHLNVYSKLSKFLNQSEKKWLSSFI